jgi:hypothetical protein
MSFLNLKISVVPLGLLRVVPFINGSKKNGLFNGQRKLCPALHIHFWSVLFNKARVAVRISGARQDGCKQVKSASCENGRCKFKKLHLKV